MTLYYPTESPPISDLTDKKAKGGIVAFDLSDWTSQLPGGYVTTTLCHSLNNINVEEYLQKGMRYKDSKWGENRGYMSDAGKLRNTVVDLVQGILNDHTEGSTRRDVVRIGEKYSIVVVGNDTIFGANSGSVSYASTVTTIEVVLDKDWKTGLDTVEMTANAARSILAYQLSRTHLHTLVITERMCHIGYFDRSGARYAPGFNYHKCPRLFLATLLAVAGFDLNTLGFDPSIRRIVDTGGNPTPAATLTLSHDEQQITYTIKELDADPDALCLQFFGPSAKTWQAVGPDGEHVVIEEYWRDKGTIPESETLEKLKDVTGVVQIVAYDETYVCTAKMPTTLPGGFEREDGQADMVQTRIVYRVIDGKMDPMLGFKTREQVLQALIDILSAQHVLANTHKMIYGDTIDLNSIFLGTRRGINGNLRDTGLLVNFTNVFKKLTMDDEEPFRKLQLANLRCIYTILYQLAFFHPGPDNKLKMPDDLGETLLDSPPKVEGIDEFWGDSVAKLLKEIYVATVNVKEREEEMLGEKEEGECIDKELGMLAEEYYTALINTFKKLPGQWGLEFPQHDDKTESRGNHNHGMTANGRNTNRPTQDFKELVERGRNEVKRSAKQYAQKQRQPHQEH